VPRCSGVCQDAEVEEAHLHWGYLIFNNTIRTSASSDTGVCRWALLELKTPLKKKKKKKKKKKNPT
jgi:hypothetical protein